MANGIGPKVLIQDFLRGIGKVRVLRQNAKKDSLGNAGMLASSKIATTFPPFHQVPVIYRHLGHGNETRNSAGASTGCSALMFQARKHHYFEVEMSREQKSPVGSSITGYAHPGDENILHNDGEEQKSTSMDGQLRGETGGRTMEKEAESFLEFGASAGIPGARKEGGAERSENCARDRSGITR